MAGADRSSNGSVDVSVLTPVLNEADHIRETVAAMRAQRFAGEVEFLFMDGGSSDATRATLEELAERISDGFAGLTKRVAQIEAARGVSDAGQPLAKFARRPPSPNGEEWTELVSDGRVEVTYSPNGSVRKVRLLDGLPLYGMSANTLMK